jgi:hypothetical protein
VADRGVKAPVAAVDSATVRCVRPTLTPSDSTTSPGASEASDRPPEGAEGDPDSPSADSDEGAGGDAPPPATGGAAIAVPVIVPTVVGAGEPESQDVASEVTAGASESAVAAPVVGVGEPETSVVASEVTAGESEPVVVASVVRVGEAEMVVVPSDVVAAVVAGDVEAKAAAAEGATQESETGTAAPAPALGEPEMPGGRPEAAAADFETGVAAQAPPAAASQAPIVPPGDPEVVAVEPAVAAEAPEVSPALSSFRAGEPGASDAEPVAVAGESEMSVAPPTVAAGESGTEQQPAVMPFSGTASATAEEAEAPVPDPGMSAPTAESSSVSEAATAIGEVEPPVVPSEIVVTAPAVVVVVGDPGAASTETDPAPAPTVVVAEPDPAAVGFVDPAVVGEPDPAAAPTVVVAEPDPAAVGFVDPAVVGEPDPAAAPTVVVAEPDPAAVGFVDPAVVGEPDPAPAPTVVVAEPDPASAAVGFVDPEPASYQSTISVWARQPLAPSAEELPQPADGVSSETGVADPEPGMVFPEADETAALFAAPAAVVALAEPDVALVEPELSLAESLLDERDAGARVEIAQPRTARWDVWTYVWFIAAVAGSAVRIEQYATRRSLWLDEALLSANLVARSFSGLLHPLANEQGAPVGWLWMERAAIVVFGQNEYALRLVALVSGVGALMVVPLVVSKAIGRRGGALAALLVGASPIAIRYSAEVKQYSSDLFIASLLVLLATVVDDRHGEGRWMWAWGGAAAASVWFSHPAVFVVAACTMALAVRAVGHGDRALVTRLIPATVVSAASFGVLYLVALRSLAANQYLRTYWASAMAPRPLSLHGLTRWLTHVIPALFSTTANFGHPLLAMAAFAVGVVVVVRTGRGPLPMVVLALAVVAMAGAAADRYPLSGRLALYLLVVLLVPFVALVDWGIAGLATRRAIALPALVLAVLALASVVDGGVKFAVHPFSTPDTRAALQFVASHQRPGDQVWVQWPDADVAQFYARAVSVEPDHVIDDGTVTGSGGCGGQTPTQASAGGRVWLVFGYRLSTAPRDERAAIVAAFDRRAGFVERYTHRGAATYLFDFAGRRTADGSSSEPGLECLTIGPLAPPAASGLHTGPLGSGKDV